MNFSDVKDWLFASGIVGAVLFAFGFVFVAKDDAAMTDGKTLAADIIASAPLGMKDGEISLVCVNGRLFAAAKGREGLALTQVFRASYNGIPERCENKTKP